MSKISKKKPINEQSKILVTKFIDAVMAKDTKGGNRALEEMINNRISAKIKKAAQTEELI